MFWLGLLVSIAPTLELETNRIIVFFSTVMLGYLILGFIKIVLAKQLSKTLTPSVFYKIRLSVCVLLVIFGIYFIFLSWDININGILASAGGLGVVRGLAAKDTVSNFFAGIFLMADAPFKEGDYILLDTGERGYVKKMGLRSTRFMTRDDIEITIPNSVIAASKIVNESGGPGEIERVRITLTVAYDSDLDEVKDLLITIAKKEKNVLKEPEPRVRFREFADHGLKLQLLFWIHNPEIRGKTVDAVNSEIYREISTRKISIPYHTMNIHVSKDST